MAQEVCHGEAEVYAGVFGNNKEARDIVIELANEVASVASTVVSLPIQPRWKR